MSTSNISSQISRLKTAKSALRTKLIARGVTVGESESLSAYPAHIDEITAAQPTLFAPIVTMIGNSISWENNPQNGSFPVTVTAKLDGAAVTSPLTVTDSMVGKTLTATASADNFESASADLYIETIAFVISAGSYTFNNTLVGSNDVRSDINFSVTPGEGVYQTSYFAMTYDGSICDLGFIYGEEDDTVWAVDGGCWRNAAYKNITVLNDTVVTEAFYNWFTANTQQ